MSERKSGLDLDSSEQGDRLRQLRTRFDEFRGRL